MKKKLINILPIIGIILYLVFFVCGNLMHITYHVNADNAAEGILAKEIWETKEWVPHTWIPSTETRIIGPPNIAALFYGISHSMQFSLGVACCITSFLIWGALYYMSQNLVGGGYQQITPYRGTHIPLYGGSLSL